MNVLLSPQLPVFPHQHENMHLTQRNRESRSSVLMLILLSFLPYFFLDIHSHDS